MQHFRWYTNIWYRIVLPDCAVFFGDAILLSVFFVFFFGGLNFVEDCNNICCEIFLAITCEKTVPVTHKHNLYALTIWKLFAGNPSLCNDSFVWNHFQPLWSKLVFGYCDRGSNQNVSKTTPTFFPNKWSTPKWPWMDMVYLQICLLPKACIQHYLHAGNITKYVPPNGRHLDVTLQHLTNWTSNVERKSNMETLNKWVLGIKHEGCWEPILTDELIWNNFQVAKTTFILTRSQCYLFGRLWPTLCVHLQITCHVPKILHPEPPVKRRTNWAFGPATAQQIATTHAGLYVLSRWFVNENLDCLQNNPEQLLGKIETTSPPKANRARSCSLTSLKWGQQTVWEVNSLHTMHSPATPPSLADSDDHTLIFDLLIDVEPCNAKAILSKTSIFWYCRPFVPPLYVHNVFTLDAHERFQRWATCQNWIAHSHSMLSRQDLEPVLT